MEHASSNEAFVVLRSDLLFSILDNIVQNVFFYYGILVNDKLK